MNISLSSTAPSKLYAFQLKLRPLERGTIMPFTGELVHAAWLEWIRAAAPDVATFLHDGNKRRLFTCSSLQFPLPIERVREAEREHVHLPLDPERTYTVRITLLHGELFPLFYSSLMHFNIARLGAKAPPFMQLGKQSFLLEEVLSDPDDRSGWTGYTSYASLVEKVRMLRLGSAIALGLEFASLTTCSWTNKTYGNYYAMLPSPELIFPPLAKRWQELAPPELADVVQEHTIGQYIRDGGMVIEDYDLRPHSVRFVKHPQRGFVGTCKYQLRGPDAAVTGDASLTESCHPERSEGSRAPAATVTGDASLTESCHPERSEGSPAPDATVTGDAPLTESCHPERSEGSRAPDATVTRDAPLTENCHPERSEGSRAPEAAVTRHALLTVRQQIILLAQLAFYTGIGYKTAMGMGQVRLM